MILSYLLCYLNTKQNTFHLMHTRMHMNIISFVVSINWGFNKWLMSYVVWCLSLQPVSIVSYNHLGNNDGKNLSAPKQFRSKEVSGFWVGTHVTVPSRNQTLFHCVFRSHYRVRSTITQYFQYGWGSYVLCKLMNTFTQHTWAPPLTELQQYGTLNAAMQSNIINLISTRNCHKCDNFMINE